MIERLFWLAIAYVGGIAAILGSLMVIGSLLLWLIPTRRAATKEQAVPVWQGKLKVLAVSVILTFVGVALLIAFPFPAVGPD